MELVWIVGLIVLSALFALCEISLAAVRKVKLQPLLDQQDPRALAVITLQNNSKDFIAAVQIMLNALAIIAGIIGESAFTPIFQSLLQNWIGEAWLNQTAFTLSFLTVTGLFILFGDLLPKRIGFVLPEAASLRLIYLMRFSVWLFKPIIWLFNKLADVLLKLFRVPLHRDDQITFEDLVAVVDQSIEHGSIEQQQYHMIGNVLELPSTNITQAMTLPADIHWLDINADQTELKRQIEQSSQRYYLVCDGGLYKVLGLVESSVILSQLLQNKPLLADKSALIQPVYLLDTLTLADAITNFKQQEVEVALVINEFTTVVGMVTLWQVLQLVALNDVETIQNQIEQNSDGGWTVPGDLAVRDFQQIAADFAPDCYESIETLSGLFIHEFKRIPKATDTVEIDGYVLVALEVTDLTVELIEIRRTI